MDEAPLQAVILADSYNRRFEVLCSDTPRILLPLCSKSLLDWTLEALSLSKVKQVFVFCGVHADLIRDHVRYVYPSVIVRMILIVNSESAFGNTMEIQCLASQTARSSGDALRELDAMGVSISYSLINIPLADHSGPQWRQPFHPGSLATSVKLRFDAHD